MSSGSPLFSAPPPPEYGYSASPAAQAAAGAGNRGSQDAERKPLLSPVGSFNGRASHGSDGSSKCDPEHPLHGETPYLHDHAAHDPGAKDSGFGAKTIGFFGGFALLVNNITGPGMVQIPVIYQQAGWLVPTVTLVLLMVLSSFSATMLCEAMAAVPGNHEFDDRVELTTLAKYYFGPFGFYATAILLIISLEAVNIAAIIVSAQTMDLTCVAIKATCGLEFYPNFGFRCPETAGEDISPFGDSYVLSMGFVIVLLMSIPLGYFNLDDNIIVQQIAWVMMLMIFAIWLFFFIYVGVDFDRVPAVGTDFSQVLGTLVFNYAFVTTVPSWVNEKKPGVSVNHSVWWSNVLSTFLFAFIGLMGAWTFHFTGSNDILNEINDRDSSRHEWAWLETVAKVTVYLFPLVTLVSGIPVFSIIIRYNLLENKLCNKPIANFIGVILPWLVALPFFTGSGLSNVINWTSLFINGVVNFIIPILLFVWSRRSSVQERISRTAGVQTLGEHHQTIITAEFPVGFHNEGSVNDPKAGGYVPHQDLFRALPVGTFAKWLAYIMIAIFTAAIIGAIALAIESSVEQSLH